MSTTKPKKTIPVKPKKKPKKPAKPKKKHVGKSLAKTKGRPPEIPSDEMTLDQLEKIKTLAQLGYSNKELAASLGICEKTFYNWIAKDSTLITVIDSGRTLASARVKEGLLKRATGFQITQTAVEKTVDKKNSAGEIIEHGKVLRYQQTTKYFPPDTKAARIWLGTYNKEEFGDVLPEGEIDNSFEEAIRKVDKQLESNPDLKKMILDDLTDEA